MNSDERTTLVVMGGAGAMGRITVKDLVETAPSDVGIVIADYNQAAAKQLAKSFKRPGVQAVGADATNVRATAKLLGDAFGVINCTQHDFNLKVMTAALQAGAHYTDLGGLFHVTKEQLALHAKFEKAGLLALLGMGAAPGITNVLARSAADTMDEVHAIHTMVANVDRTPDRPETPLGTSYSIQTILDEASRPAATYQNGKLQFVEPMSGAEPVTFPEPVGVRRPAHTIHSEVATLCTSYKAKGCRDASFKIAFPEALDDKLRFLRAIGMLSDDPIQVGRAKVSARQVLLAALSTMKKVEYHGVPDEYEIVRAVVRGVRGNKMVEETVDCHVPGIPSWGFGVDVDTGCPPSIAMQMLLRGEIEARGCLPPELSVPPDPFFGELLKRGMTVRRRVSVTDMPGARSSAIVMAEVAIPANGASAAKAETAPAKAGKAAKPAKKRGRSPKRVSARA